MDNNERTLQEIRERFAKVSSDDWQGRIFDLRHPRSDDEEFIFESRSDVATLLREIDALKSTITGDEHE